MEALRLDGGITIVAHRLDEIPSADLDANRCYHIWDGTDRQAHEFREAVWAPAWMSESDKPLTSKLLQQRNLVYGHALTGLVFLPRTRADDLAQMYEARRTAKTWGEFRRGFPNSEQLEFLPDDVVELGEITDTGEGDRLDLPVEREEEIVKRLRAEGFHVERDDQLVNAAADPVPGPLD